LATRTNEGPREPLLGTGFSGFSVGDLLLGAAQRAVVDSAGECSRAEGRRGMVYLKVDLCLGDRGEPLWLESSVHFSQKRHQKDARETARGEVD
jgi:hypothetical protein